jgi:hypothetical protein
MAEGGQPAGRRDDVGALKEFYLAQLEVRPCVESDVPLIMTASRDKSITANTYLPCDASAEEAAAYLADHRDRGWVLLVGGLAVGFIGYADAPPHDTYTPPPGSVEISTWMLANFRGYELANVAYDRLLPALRARGISHLFSLIWTSNMPSKRRLVKSGAELVVQYMWHDRRPVAERHRLPSGMCDLWVRHI